MCLLLGSQILVLAVGLVLNRAGFFLTLTAINNKSCYKLSAGLSIRILQALVVLPFFVLINCFLDVPGSKSFEDLEIWNNEIAFCSAFSSVFSAASVPSQFPHDLPSGGIYLLPLKVGQLVLDSFSNSLV